MLENSSLPSELVNFLDRKVSTITQDTNTGNITPQRPTVPLQISPKLCSTSLQLINPLFRLIVQMLGTLLVVFTFISYVWLLQYGEIDGTTVAPARHIASVLKIICLVSGGYRGDPGARAPLAPKICLKSCSFQAILRETPYFDKLLGSGPLGVKTPLGPLDQNPGSVPAGTGTILQGT